MKRASRRLMGVLVAVAIAGGTAGAAGAEERVLFRYDGKAYSTEDLSPPQRQFLHEADVEHFDKQKQVADALLFEVFMGVEAEKAGRAKEELARERLAVPMPDEAAVQAFYDANKAQIPYPYEQVRQQITQMLLSRSMQVKRDELVATIKAGGGFELLVPVPRPPVVEVSDQGFPSKGPDDAPVTVIEFADYQCPHCKHASSALKRLMERYPGKVRVVFIDFPINRSGISRLVAEGAVCAAEQGRFWDYHDTAFARQALLDRAAPGDIASELELDQAVFEACLATDAPRTQVARGEEQARRLGLDSTPTIFVNGVRAQLDDMDRDLAAAVDRALSAGS